MGQEGVPGLVKDTPLPPIRNAHTAQSASGSLAWEWGSGGTAGARPSQAECYTFLIYLVGAI